MAKRAAGPAAQQLNDDHDQLNDAQRDANGRFAAGNRGGPGNPFARRAAELRKAVQDAVSPEDLQRIVQRLVTQAILGDMPSIKILFGYVLGKFPEPVNPDTLDHEEVRMYQQNLTGGELQEAAQQKSPPRVSLSVLRGMTIAREESARQMLAEPEPAVPVARRSTAGASRPEAAASASGKRASELPSTNGENGATGYEPPSPNGGNGATAQEPPSPNAGNGAAAQAPPSPNRDNGASGRKPSPLWRQSLFGKPAGNGRDR